METIARDDTPSTSGMLHDTDRAVNRRSLFTKGIAHE